MAFVMRTSIHGRRLGLSSTGGIIAQPQGTTSTAIELAAQMWGPGMLETISATEGTLTNYGTTILSTGVVSGSVFTLPAPEEGVQKEIVIDAATPATAITLNTTATTIDFYSTGANSTALSFAGTDLAGAVVTLRGMGSTHWQVMSRSATVS